MYTAYVLDDVSRESLAERFPPQHGDFIGHHVTVQFGVPADAELPDDADLQVIGYVNDPDGLEALVVAVNKNRKREDGSTYHITWSLDREKFSPKDSNELLKRKQFTLTLPITIQTTPSLLK